MAARDDVTRRQERLANDLRYVGGVVREWQQLEKYGAVRFKFQRGELVRVEFDQSEIPPHLRSQRS